MDAVGDTRAHTHLTAHGWEADGRGGGPEGGDVARTVRKMRTLHTSHSPRRPANDRIAQYRHCPAPRGSVVATCPLRPHFIFFKCPPTAQTGFRRATVSHAQVSLQFFSHGRRAGLTWNRARTLRRAGTETRLWASRQSWPLPLARHLSLASCRRPSPCPRSTVSQPRSTSACPCLGSSGSAGSYSRSRPRAMTRDGASQRAMGPSLVSP